MDPNIFLNIYSVLDAMTTKPRSHRRLAFRLRDEQYPVSHYEIFTLAHLPVCMYLNKFRPWNRRDMLNSQTTSLGWSRFLRRMTLAYILIGDEIIGENRISMVACISSIGQCAKSNRNKEIRDDLRN